MNKLDDLLYETLREQETPPEQLNRRVLKKARMEDYGMVGKKKLVAAAAVALCITLAGGTGYAAYHYLTAKQTAEYLGSQELSKYFKDSDVVATKKDGDYRFRYLGNASAKLKKTFFEQKDTKTTYVALAVDRLDGKPMTEDEEFVASPLIQGLNPKEYNVYTMDGGAVWDIKDGVLYMIMNVNSIEMFADRDVYLAITKGADYAKGYRYDEQSGKITENDNFDGINVLFKMNLDEKKADKAAQKEYLERFGSNEDNEEIHIKAADETMQALVDLDYEKLTDEEIDEIVKKGTCIDSYDFKAGEDGMYSIRIKNKYFTEEGVEAKDNYNVNEPFFTMCDYREDENAIIYSYSVRDKDDVLHCKFILLTEEQAKDLKIN